MLMSKLRKRWVLFRNPQADIRFTEPVYLGPRFSLHMPDGGTFIAGPGTEFRRGFRAEVGGDGRVEIGSMCVFTYDVVIQCSTEVVIGDHVMFGQASLIVDGNHRFRDLDTPMLQQGYDFRPLKIADHATVTTKCTIINTAFTAGLATLTLLRGLIVAIFLDPSDYGVWGILVIGLGTLSWLKQVGLSEKYIQQDEADQEAAFHKAFTLELIANVILAVVLLAGLPVAVAIYGHDEIVAPGLVCISILPALVLQTPLWVFYRRMEFVRQRTLQAIDPVIGFVVAVVLAAAGAGYWALVASMVVGAWATAIFVWRASPYPLRWNWDRGTAREYFTFSWPLSMSGLGLLVMAQGTLIAASRSLGLAAVGALTIANAFSIYTHRLDEIITSTLYPAICAVKDRTSVLTEAFVKSNRLTLMWGMPFGVGLALFAGDLVHYVIGDKWTFAIDVIRASGLVAAMAHIAFNWTAFHRALDRTRPIAAATWIGLASYGLIVIPLLLVDDLDGYAIGIFAAGVIQLLVRGWFMHRLLNGFDPVAHALRAVLPTVPAAAVVLLTRVAEPWHRTAVVAVAEIVLYLLVTGVATWLLERGLLREAIGYVRRGSRRGVAEPAVLT
jgi:O-antigen/teichoic acid export membrane protein